MDISEGPWEDSTGAETCSNISVDWLLACESAFTCRVLLTFREECIAQGRLEVLCRSRYHQEGIRYGDGIRQQDSKDAEQSKTICRTPMIDLHEVWSINGDGDSADVGKVAILTAPFFISSI